MRNRESASPKHVSNMGGTLKCADAATKKYYKCSNFKFALFGISCFFAGYSCCMLLYVRQSFWDKIFGQVLLIEACLTFYLEQKSDLWTQKC